MAKFKKVSYSKLNSKQKENFNFHNLASVLATFGFNSIWLNDDVQGADFLAVPSAFTKNTGERHWHILLRSRAIENFCYVLAPAQTGKHFNNRETYGHSVIVSPDGAILSEKKEGLGFIISEIDTEKIKKIRSEIPSTSFD